MSDEITGLKLSDNTYANAKFFVQIVLPALGVLYATLSTIWGFSEAEKVVGSINAVALFLGIILRISSSNYYKGVDKTSPDGKIIITHQGEEGSSMHLQLDKNVDVSDGSKLTFQVEQNQFGPEDSSRE